MNFRASFCDPFKPDIIEIGDIEKDKIMGSMLNTVGNHNVNAHKCNISC